jgi:ATP-binding cassette subfamily G (WHITE) protein 2
VPFLCLILIGAFFFIVMSFMFSNLSTIDLFINERNLFIHEKASGYYR